MTLLQTIRKITEDLDNCFGFCKTEDGQAVTVIFRFTDPVDKITWELSKSFYELYIKNMLIASKDKFIPLEAESKFH